MDVNWKWMCSQPTKKVCHCANLQVGFPRVWKSISASGMKNNRISDTTEWETLSVFWLIGGTSHEHHDYGTFRQDVENLSSYSETVSEYWEHFIILKLFLRHQVKVQRKKKTFQKYFWDIQTKKLRFLLVSDTIQVSIFEISYCSETWSDNNGKKGTHYFWNAWGHLLF